MQIKVTMIYHYTPQKVALIRKNKCGKDIRAKGPSFTARWNVNWLTQYFWEIIWTFMKILGIELPSDPKYYSKYIQF